MDPNVTDVIMPGSDVRSSDDEKVGTVSSVHAAFIKVEKGFIFHKDFHVPLTAIAAIDPGAGHIVLNVTKDQVLANDWETRDDSNDPPTDTLIDESSSTTTLTGAVPAASLPTNE